MLYVNLLCVSVIFFCLFYTSFCLYEDQIGKFDWKHSYVGKLKFAKIETAGTVKKLFVATEQNVLAALHLKTGQIIWRQVLEKDTQGEIQFLNGDTDSIVTVSGRIKIAVRFWDAHGGFLLQEWTYMPQHMRSLREMKWFIHEKLLYETAWLEQAQLAITAYNVSSGAVVSSKTITIPWSRCVVAAHYLACLESDGGAAWLHSYLLVGPSMEIQRSDLSDLLAGREAGNIELELIPGREPIIALVFKRQNIKRVLHLQENGFTAYPWHLPVESKPFVVANEGTDLLIQEELKNEWLEVSANEMETFKEVTDLSGKMKYPSHLGEPEIMEAICSPRKEKGLGCRIVLSTEDHGIALVFHPGKLMWFREEALASIEAVEILDLPVSDTDVAIEKEFDHQEMDLGVSSGFVGMFIHRLTSQVLQLRALLLTTFGLGEPPSAGQRAGLVRDVFGFHKMIVAVSSAGKVFGIDTQSSEIIWQHRLDRRLTYGDLASGGKVIPIFVQRSARHFPYAAQCALLLKDKVTGEGSLFVFNPITGQTLAEDGGVVRLGYKVKQSALLHQANKEFLRGILLLDQEITPHVYPECTFTVAQSVANFTFMYTVDPNTGILNGYAFNVNREKKLRAYPIWKIQVAKTSQNIIQVIGKSPAERVHSQGRVLGDRSVLYKYVNPNLVAVVTQGFDPVHKQLLNIYLIDVVSGSVVFSISHKRAREPIHVLHSENWILYSYFSDKARRTEIVTLDLYEGKDQSNTTAFSSLAAPVQPIVDRQAYILPSWIEGMKETVTEKGVTSKHILMALASGGILEVPWIFVDPRRPITITPEMREEGVIPYMPELPMPYDAIINYNQSVHRVRGVYTVPSGIESTCLVFVYGLDVFYTRVAPSKKYDILKEDFDHSLITFVLLGLMVASYVTKKFTSRKTLKQAWK